MDVLVLSDNRKISEKFKIRRQKDVVSDIVFAAVDQLTAQLGSIRAPTLCYLDLAGLDEKKVSSCLRSLARTEHVVYAVIDPSGSVKDVARLFQEGAVDYLNRFELNQGVGLARLRRVRGFIQRTHPAFLQTVVLRAADRRKAVYLVSEAAWEGVVPGREYTFCIMFIELDGKEQMEKKYGMKNLSIALSSFRGYLESFVRPFNGRMWIWLGFGGIVLFPFDARSCPALSCAFRLMLYKHLYDIEGSHFPTFLSFRVALHLGNTLYTEENTGNIVSDSLNSIFHLGQQFARPGNCYVTEEVFQFGHPSLRGFFLEAGTFEGRKILRLRLPLHRIQATSTAR